MCVMAKICPTCAATFPASQAFCPSDGTALRSDMPGDAIVGTVVAERYLVTELLGEGGMGKVYLAQHVKLPRRAALKVLHQNMVRDADALARFNREATNASKIDHERVARVFDFGETATGLVYLAMEYVDGRTLKQALAEDGPMSLSRTATLVRQIADGLDAAHRSGIVHRDLKPDNILVAKTAAGGDACKVVDFGIAKALGSGERSLTRTGFVVGTPEYMSPEQLLGEPIDHRSDVYALALLGYQCLTGVTPFDSRTPDRGLMARLANEPRSLVTVRPDKQWPVELQAALNKGMARDRERRYRTAGMFAEAFERAALSRNMVQADTPDSATAPPASSRAAKASKVKAARTPGAASKSAASAPAPGAASAPVAAAPPAPWLATPPAAYAPPPHPHMPVAPAAQPAQMLSVAPSRRRWLPSLPHLPIMRWAGTALLLWFVWLVYSEGSVRRAVRRATAVARSVESDARRLLSDPSPRARAPASAPAAAPAADPTSAPDAAPAAASPPVPAPTPDSTNRAGTPSSP